eukprot:GEZU01012691.1.p1 GENE.GEZU01012691.1~~GEZU01012691.1.p1  ORF type:complete len:292 (-),score=93.27 GEZU01012691.1:280-1155(-)
MSSIVDRTTRNKLARELNILSKRKKDLAARCADLERREQRVSNRVTIATDNNINNNNNNAGKSTEEERDSKRRRMTDGASTESTQQQQQQTGSRVARDVEQMSSRRRQLLQDPEMKKRGRALFGILRGTLEKNKNQEKSEAEKKREQKNHQIEESIEKEKKQSEELALQRIKAELQEKSAERDRIEKRFEKFQAVLKKIAEYDHDYQMRNFLQTKTKPSIYYVPKKHNEITQSMLDKKQKDAEDKKAEVAALLREIDIIKPEDVEMKKGTPCISSSPKILVLLYSINQSSP